MEKKEIEVFFFVFDIKGGSWSMIGDHPAFSDRVPQKPPMTLDGPLFYLGSGEKILGPFLKSQLVRDLKENKIGLYDFIFSPGEREWIRIKDSPYFIQYLPRPPLKLPNIAPKLTPDDKTLTTLRKREKVSAPVRGKKESGLTGSFEIRNDPVWMIIKGEEELGPFRYLEVLRMIQKNIISKINRIKKINDVEWRKISDIFEFNTSHVKKIVEDGGRKVARIFLTRKHKRAPFYGPARVQFKRQIYKGMCTSISAGGCFIEMGPQDFKLHEEAQIKIIPGDLPLLTIEARGKVVSLNQKGPKGVGFSFLNLTQEMMGEIQKFVNKHWEKKSGDK